MSDTVSSGIVFTADTTQVVQAKEDLQNLAAAAGQTSTAAKGIDAAFLKMTAAAGGMAASLDKLVALQTEARNSLASLAGGANGINSLAQANANLAASAKPAAAAVAAVGQAHVTTAAAAAQSAGSINKLGQSHAALGNQQKLNAYQAAQMSAQLQDLFVQIQAGGSPMTALIQQGSQLSAVFGGFGPALRALGGLFTASRVAMGGFAAALVAVGLAYKQGVEENDAFAKSLILTGNQAGVTTGQLAVMAKAISDNVGTQGKAAEVLAMLAGSARVGAAELQKVAEAAIRLERAGGPAIEETVKRFAALGKDPVQASISLNEQTGFLTESLYRQIKALSDQGKESQAAALAQKAYAETAATQTAQLEARLGTLEKAWRFVASAAKGAWDAMLNIGRGSANEEKLAAIGEKIADLEKTRDLAGRGGRRKATIDAQIEALRLEQSTLQEIARLENQAADKARLRAKATEAGIDAERMVTAAKSDQLKLSDEIARANRIFSDASFGASPERAAALEKERKDVIKDITQRAAATQRANSIELTGIEAAKQARLDASKLIEQSIASQVKRGDLSEFEASKRRAELALDDNEAVLDALKQQLKVTKGMREPGDLIAKINNDIAASQREQVRLSVILLHLNEDIAAAAAKRVTTPQETFRTSELQAQAEIEAAQAKARQAIAQAYIDYTIAQKVSNDEMTLEVALIGKANSQRTIEIQQLAIKAKLEADIRAIKAGRFDPAEEAKQIADATARANKALADVGTKDAVKLMQDLLDPERPRLFGEAFGDAFGKIGSSLGKVISSFNDYSKSQTKFQVDLKKLKDAQAPAGADQNDFEIKRQKSINELIEKQGSLQLETYANAAGAAKGFFEEGTRGYKALQAAEAVFRIAQLAGDLQRGLSAAAVGVATQAQGDPYSAFPRMAAMAAAMAALGFATGLVGSSGPTSNTATSAQRQGGAATGQVVTADQLDRNSKTFIRGTVLGMDDAKSESISNSLDHLADKADLTLPLTTQMTAYLRSISNGIAGLAATIVQAVGLTSENGLNIATGKTYNPGGAFGTTDPVLAALRKINPGANILSNFAFGSVKREVSDTGLDISGAINNLLVRSFAEVTTTKKGAFGGLFGGNSTTTSDEYGTVSNKLQTQVGLLFKDIGKSAQIAADSLGGNSAELAQKVADFYVSIPRLSLKDLDGEEAKAQLSAAFSGQADKLAELLTPGLADFIKVGEGYYETLVRVGTGVEEAGQVLEQFGLKAGDFSSIIQKQGDVAAELTRQAIDGVETVGGSLTSVGKMIDTLGGSASDIADTYSALVDVRDIFKALGGSGEELTTSVLKGAGSLDTLKSSLDSFISNFYTDAERQSIAMSQITAEFGRLGIKEVPATREAFKSLVLQLFAGDEASQKLGAKVLTLSNAFADAVPPANDLLEALNKFKDLGAVFNYLKTLPAQFVNAVAAASGGLENLVSNLSGYFDNFFTDAQKGAEAFTAVQNALSAVGLQVPKTNQQFIELLTAQVKLGEAGAPAVAALLSVQGAFKTFTDSLEAEAHKILDKALGLVERSVGAQKDKNTDKYNADIKAIDDLEKAARASFKAKQDQIKAERTIADLAKETAESVADNALKLLDAQDKVAKKAYELALQAAEDASKLLDTQYAKNDSAVTKRQIGTDTDFAQFALDIANNIALANGTLGDGYDKALSDAKDAQKFLETAFSAGELGASMLAEQGKAAANAFDLAGKALDAAIEAATNSVNGIRELQDLLKSTISSLRPVGSEEIDRKRAQLQINTALAEAQSSGKLPNAEDIRSALQAVSKPSQDFFGSKTDYLRDFFKTSISLKSLSGITGVKLDAAEQALKVAEKQRDDLQKYHDAEIKQYDLVRAALKDQYDIAKKGAEDIIAAIQAAEKTRGEALEVAKDAINTALDDARKAYDETIKSLNTRNDTAQTELDAALEKYGLDRDALKAAYDKAQKSLDDILDEAKKAYNAALGIDDSVDNVESAVINLGTAIKGYGEAIGQSMATALGPLIDALNNFKLQGGGVYTGVTPVPAPPPVTAPTPAPTPVPAPSPTIVTPIGVGTTPTGPNPDPTVDRTPVTGTYNGSKDGEEGTPGGSAATQQQIIDIIMSGLATGSYGAIKTALEPVGLGAADIDRIAGLTQGTWGALTTNSNIGANSVSGIVNYLTQLEAMNGPGWDKDTVTASHRWALSQGYTSHTLDAVLKQRLGSINELVNSYGLPSFAQGTNIVPRDMVAQIHKDERIIPAADNRALLAALRNPGIANEVLIEEVKALRKELQDIKAGTEAVAKNTGRTAKIQDRWDGDGLPDTRPTT